MTYIAKKVTANNHLPGEGDGRFPVYSKQFNELVEAFLELEGTDGTFTLDIINEKTAGSGVTIDSVLLKDGGITATSSITTSGATAGIGFATGAGGTVTQTTSRATGVEISTPCGAITTDTTSLAAGAEATFTVTNTLVASTDVVVVSMATITTGTPVAYVTDVSDGSFDITISNLHASTADTSADVINYVIIKGVSA